MPSLDTDTLVCISGHWWWFPTASVDLNSAEFEWRDNRLYLLQPDGSAVEGIILVGEVGLD